MKEETELAVSELSLRLNQGRSPGGFPPSRADRSGPILSLAAVPPRLLSVMYSDQARTYVQCCKCHIWLQALKP